MSEPASTLSATEQTDGESGRYVLEAQIGYLLRRSHQRATSIFTANLADLQLTPTQLAALAKIRDQGEVSQNLLGRLTAMDPATMQGVIKRLGDRGLITRAADATDRRRTLLALTPAGEQLLDRAVSRGIRTSEETLAPLTARERETFLRLLEKLV
jgi:DNA-binding MarR family transcriptional regulator